MTALIPIPRFPSPWPILDLSVVFESVRVFLIVFLTIYSHYWTYAYIMLLSCMLSMKTATSSEVAALLSSAASEIEALGDELVEAACTESHLPEMRIRNETGRTAGQLRSFAELVKEGSWYDFSFFYNAFLNGVVLF